MIECVVDHRRIDRRAVCSAECRNDQRLKRGVDKRSSLVLRVMLSVMWVTFDVRSLAGRVDDEGACHGHTASVSALSSSSGPLPPCLERILPDPLNCGVCSKTTRFRREAPSQVFPAHHGFQ